MNDMEIKTKSIFDFCNDLDVLKFITKDKSPSRNSYVSKKNTDERVHDMKMLAYITSDDKLGQAVFNVSPSIVEWTKDVVDYATKYRKKHGMDDD
jgi:hypothetical protein